jgi:3-hydroxyisobutyrate dehydrogenase-like beta-hydroxyacid dehydrogenase
MRTRKVDSPPQNMKLAFVGLGGMGCVMAENLLAEGHDLVVYNRTAARAGSLCAKGARLAPSAAEAARGREVVVSMLANDEAVEEVTLGEDGIVSGLSENAIHMSSSTISVALSERLAIAHAGAKQGYVAAPVFGRPDAAAARKLWIVTAGAHEQVDRCAPIFEALGRGVTRLGDRAPTANLVKLAGNFIIASMLETMGEAFALTQKAGVDAQTFCDVFVNVFARSPIFEGYAKRIAAGEYEPAGFKATLGLKDVRLALAAGDAHAVPMPIASLVRDHLLSAVAQGKGDLDWSILARLAGERAGIGVDP